MQDPKQLAIIGTQNTAEEGDVLLAIAAQSLQYQSGKIASEITVPLPEPCQTEEKPYCTSGAETYLRWILATKMCLLLPEWATNVALNHQVVPPTYLSDLLMTCKLHKPLRIYIVSVLGERGRWLARQSDTHQWVFKSAYDVSAKTLPICERWKENDLLNLLQDDLSNRMRRGHERIPGVSTQLERYGGQWSEKLVTTFIDCIMRTIHSNLRFRGLEGLMRIAMYRIPPALQEDFLLQCELMLAIVQNFQTPAYYHHQTIIGLQDTIETARAVFKLREDMVTVINSENP